uniref:B30.2/SPRY domain-containing protein n=1 Tax=Erpetoichthys calabaricus TaxID=27687 RepID=A0A8C4XE34_ERPCA
PPFDNVICEYSQISCPMFLEKCSVPSSYDSFKACTGKRLRAVKSCIDCQASFCETHIQPHHHIAAWKDHKLIEPKENLQQAFCVKHNKGLEIFCKTDQACLCIKCFMDEHRTHDIVELEKERAEKQKRNIYKRYYSVRRCDEVAFRIKAGVVFETILTLPLSELLLFIFYFQLFKEYHWLLSSLPPDSCPITLDPNTAHRQLNVSEENKKVTVTEKQANYDDNPDRFDNWWQILSREALTGTRCYWEVDVCGKVAEIGITYKGIGRKGNSNDSKLGSNNHSWSMHCSNCSSSLWHNNKSTISKTAEIHYRRVGVYLDWSAGILKFYGVTDSAVLLHTFQTKYTEPLYPAFRLPYHNCSVTICTISQTGK